jgi:hypothetical protein
MLDRMDFNQSKQEILAIVNSITQQQVAQSVLQTNEGEKV